MFRKNAMPKQHRQPNHMMNEVNKSLPPSVITLPLHRRGKKQIFGRFALNLKYFAPTLEKPVVHP